MKKFVVLLAAAVVALCCMTSARAQQPVLSCAFNVAHNSTACENTPIASTAQESSHLFRGNGSGNSVSGVLSSIDVANWSQTQNLTIMLVDANAVPSGGALTACTPSPNNNSACLIKWFNVATANGTSPGIFTRSWAPGPLLRFVNGLIALCSSTGPLTFTPVANCTFSAELL